MNLVQKIKLIQEWAEAPADGVFGDVTATAILKKAGVQDASPPLIPSNAPTDAGAVLTERVACELVGHEAIVLEAYLDSENVWTWGVGVTNRSGHSVDRYKDNPQTVERCLEIYVWLLRTRYIPDVLRAFKTVQLTEAQFAAALSFHYNTGAILKTDWVGLVLKGSTAEARHFLENHYLNGGDLKERRMKEAKLFFDGTWTGDGKTTIWPVHKPSYHPDWVRGRRVDIRDAIRRVLAK